MVLTNKLGKLYSNIVDSPLLYIALRYVSYILAFTNSILLLEALGEHSYGIYSFSLLFMSYFTYLFLGIEHSLNTLLSMYKRDINYVKLIWSNTITIFLYISLFIVIIGVCTTFLWPTLFSKYNFGEYKLYLIIYGIVTALNSLYVAQYRVYAKLLKINFQQLLQHILITASILIYKSDSTLIGILSCMLSAQIISLILFSFNSPIVGKITLELKLLKTIVFRGINLMTQTLCYGLITILATTLVSFYFTPEELGFYSLANMIANNVVLIIGSFMFIIYPKLLNRFATSTISQSVGIVEKVHCTYVFGVDTVCLLSLLIVPVVELFFPEYKEITNSLKILIAAKLVLNSTNGFVQYIISKGKEIVMTKYASISAVVVLIVGWILIKCQLPSEYVSISVFCGLTVYSSLILRFSFKELDLGKEFLFKYIMTIRKTLTIIAIIISFLLSDNVFSILSIIVIYLALNIRNIVSLTKYSLKIFSNKKILSI